MKNTIRFVLFFAVILVMTSICLAEELPQIIIEPKLLDSVRNPTPYAGKIILSFDGRYNDSLQMNKLDLVASDTIIFTKELLEERPFEYNSTMYLVEKVLVDTSLIFEDKFESGAVRNLTIKLYFDYLNESNSISQTFSIHILPPLPNDETDKSTGRMALMSLPSQNGLYYGDLHIHTGYSSWIGYDGDFWSGDDNCGKESLNWGGSTIEEIKSQAAALDLDWFTITDHSYCLDSSEWANLKSECEGYSDSTFLCVAGEEMSVDEEVGDFETLCDNNKLETAHLGIRGINNLVEQTPTEVWCPNEPHAQDVIDQVNLNNGISIVNHPYTELEIWDFESFDADAITNETGVEVWNGEWDSYDESAHNKWVQLLLNGKKIFAFSGTDTHDGASDIVYTGVYLDNFQSANLIYNLKKGKSFISNNGAIRFTIQSNLNTAQLGDTFVNYGESSVIQIYYNVINRCNLTLFKGIQGDKESAISLGWISGNGNSVYYPTLQTNSYYRLECLNNTNRIYTNPIWIKKLTPTCSDGVQNGDEIGIDCGGRCLTSNNEMCNNIDDNRNCLIDENLTQKESCGLGICTEGQKERTCSNGLWGGWSSCSTANLAHSESCNGLDDDCDGTIDGNENITRQCGVSNIGICTYGTETCNNNGNYTNCNAILPTEEKCGDGLDQNCDGSDLICQKDYTIYSPITQNYSDDKVPINITLVRQVPYLKYFDLSVSKPSAKPLCTKCTEYGFTKGKTLSLSDGYHDINIFSTDGLINETIPLFVDSTAPRVINQEPGNKEYCTSQFIVKYSEDYLKNVKLYYGTNLVENSSCPAGRNQLCDFNVDLNSYENKNLTFHFEVQDTFDTVAYRRNHTCLVDTIPPHINTPIWRKDGYYIFLNISLDQKAKYIKYSDNGGRESSLCSNCGEYGASKVMKKYFSKGSHSVVIIAEDAAGNREYSQPLIFTTP